MTVRFHLTTIRMAIIKKKPTNTGENVLEKNPAYTVVGM
jgi:hypothetical protein